jgi:hypothetical protein
VALHYPGVDKQCGQPSQTDEYDNSDKQKREVCVQSVEIAATLAEHEIQHTIEVVSAVVRDADDATVVPQLLNVNVRLEMFP